jgi:GNAT superfamily N-acetyltransferase
MPIPDNGLRGEIEATDISARLERAALRSLHAAATPRIAARLGLRWQEIGGGAASIAAALPPSAIVVNRALGRDRDGARQAAKAYAAAGVARFFLNGTDPGLPGIGQVRGWQKFARTLDGPVPEPRRDLSLRELGPDDGPPFAAIVCAAFDLGEGAEPWLARLPGRPGWRIFGAVIGGEIAGVGGLFHEGCGGWTDWGATRPAFRSRGVQQALLAHRVRLARDMGLGSLHTCTGEAVPGDPQHSYANILRAGFVETTLRPNWAPPGPAPLANPSETG